MHMPGIAWAAVGEAYLEGNAAMYLENPTGSWMGHYLVSKISPRLDGKGPAVDASLPHDSAWRVIQLGDTPGELVESNIFTDLNPANRVADTSWIHPGKASWDWWNGDLGPDGKSAYTTRKHGVLRRLRGRVGISVHDAGRRLDRQRHHQNARQCRCAGTGAVCREEECEGMDLAVLKICRRADEGRVPAV